MRDPHSGLSRRHHVLDASFQQAIRVATRESSKWKAEIATSQG
jgi:hypothetical protein